MFTWIFNTRWFAYLIECDQVSNRRWAVIGELYDSWSAEQCLVRLEVSQEARGRKVNLHSCSHVNCFTATRRKSFIWLRSVRPRLKPRLYPTAQRGRAGVRSPLGRPRKGGDREGPRRLLLLSLNPPGCFWPSTPMWVELSRLGAQFQITRLAASLSWLIKKTRNETGLRCSYSWL